MRWFIIICAVLFTAQLFAQQKAVVDSITPIQNEQFTPLQTAVTDSTVKPKKHNPKLATRRSAIIPGWGQAYNKQYWKIPIVVGALAIPTATFIYNNSWYRKTAFAYEAKYNAAFLKDSSMLNKIDPQLARADLASLQTFRNLFRRDRDYSILWFFILWGINVVDATVSGHLKEFNVSDDLSMKFSPSYNPINRTPGINLVVNVRNNTARKPTSNITK